ncbi:MAG: pyridoxamine 5'-phosphate oxidase family protein [Thermoleophilia bacterium]|nr:pyridoxamine 5'-phosphate oxidase family protein [Thermoleophilia bacterium]
MSRRELIQLTDEEIIGFLDEQRVMIATTNGVRGWPHSMPLWYLPRNGETWAWTYAKSQKVRNLERDNRATILIETGDAYAELRGVMFEAEAVLHNDTETVTSFARELGVRYSKETGVDGDGAAEVFASQISKRVVMQFKPVNTASWDHRKLAGTY